MKDENEGKKCYMCMNFNHALEAMTDHVDFHTCSVHGGKINMYDEVRSCMCFVETEVNKELDK